MPRSYRYISEYEREILELKGQGFLYLSIIRDLYDNSIVSYKT